jgi:hypothetical protein
VTELSKYVAPRTEEISWRREEPALQEAEDRKRRVEQIIADALKAQPERIAAAETNLLRGTSRFVASTLVAGSRQP